MRITQDALTRFGRPFAAAVAGVAMLGAMAVVTPATQAYAAGVDCTVDDYDSLKDCLVNTSGVGIHDVWNDTYTMSGVSLTIDSKGLIRDGSANDLAGTTTINLKDGAKLTINGDTSTPAILRFFQFNVSGDSTLTLTGDLTIDDTLATKGLFGYNAEIPVTLGADGHLKTSDKVKLESDNGDADSKAYAVHLNGSNATAVLGGEGQYDGAANGAQSAQTYPTIYGADGAVVADEGLTGTKITISAGEVLQENGGTAAVQAYGDTVVTGTAHIESVAQRGGTFTMNGGSLDRSLFTSYNSIAGGNWTSHDYNSLTLENGAKGYITKGNIYDVNSPAEGTVKKSVSVSADSQLYIQSAKKGDVKIDSTDAFVGKALGDANAETVYSSPSLGAELSAVAPFTDNTKLIVNYDLGGETDFPALVASDTAANNTKEALNTSVQRNSTYLLSTYAGYHGQYLVYGRYVLNNADEQSTLIDGTGTVLVYGVPNNIDYEWYSAAEITSIKRSGKYPDATRDDQSYVKSTYNGRKFAGWFKSGDDWNKGANFNAFNSENNFTSIENAVTNVDGTPGQNKFGWAHFADAKNLTVGAQESADGKNIRFLSTLDSRKYQKFGFKLSISYNGQTKTADVTTNKVYDYVKVEGYWIKPSQTLYNVSWGQFLAPDITVLAPDSFGPTRISNGEDGYFTTTLLKNVPSDLKLGSRAITVTPYWVTLDGTTVTGEPQTK